MHLKQCIPLWSCVQDNIPEFILSPDVDVLLGLHSANPTQVLGVVLAFHIYHSCQNLVVVSERQLWEKGLANFVHFVQPHQSNGVRRRD